MKAIDLPEFVNQLQSGGRYSFLKVEAGKSLAMDTDALKKALWRLERKNRIRLVKRGFYVIVPLEYSRTGVIPADWFIADLMKFLDQPYYVGLLSAASIYGAAHQQPQEFQVVVPVPVRDVVVHGLQIKFFKKAGMRRSSTNDVKTSTGYMRVSNPAVTAIDLVTYAGRVGGLDRVLTVLQELSEKITQDMLVEAAGKEERLSCVQRLGWLLEKTGNNSLVSKLADWVSKKDPQRTPLDPASPRAGFPRDMRWNVIVNTDVEGEL